MNSAVGVSRTPVSQNSPLFPERFRFIEPTLPPLEKVLGIYEPAYAQGTITNASIVARFESAVAERLGVAHCVAVSSCTVGLMLVLRCLDLRGEIILPSFTFFATGHAAVWNGLQPVFADCDPHSWTIDVADTENKITAETRAILAVHLYGNPCEVDLLERIAKKHELKLIFDAAHAFGSLRHGRPVGKFGDAEVFSLSPTKLLVAGEGGLVTTDDAVLARRLRAGRNYGDLGAYDPELIGLNARMSEFNAALGLAGLDLLDSKVARRNQIAEMYTNLLFGMPGLSFQQIDASNRSSFKDYSVCINAGSFGLSRDQIAEALLAENIETKRYFYPPLHQQMLYRQYYDRESDGLRNTAFISSGILSLPIYESLPDESIEKIALAIARLAQ